MNTCKWDDDAKAYLEPDGERCDVARNGHCTARKTCSQHVGWGELTCARCVGRTRTDIRAIVDRSAELMTEAVVSGVDSEAFSLAGPGTDPGKWSWRKVAAKRGETWHLSLVEEDDDWHPLVVLSRWAMMLAEDYDLPLPEQWTIANAAGMLDRHLHRIAQDEDQDFRLLRGEMSKCRGHIEAVLRDSQQPERGAMCPECRKEKALVRLVREYPHWCSDPECTQQFHFTTDEADVWVCPRNKDHWWTQVGYADMLKDRRGA